MDSSTKGENDLLLQQAQRIQASGLLRGRLLHLFEFLRDATLAGHIPKELEVAQGVFERGAAFDVAQDAMVRVYVHKLRRKLEEYQRGPGAHDPFQVLIPRGEYRLALEKAETVSGTADPQEAAAGRSEQAGIDQGRTHQAPADHEGTPPEDSFPLSGHIPAATVPARGAPAFLPRIATRGRGLRSWLPALLAVSLVVNALLAFFLLHGGGQAATNLRAMRRSPIWAPILKDDRPIVVLLGDYYIFGETDTNGMEVERLVREFTINSREDLAQYLQTDPSKIGRYEDIGLSYLPTSTAPVLRDVMPLLAATGRPLRVAMASELEPAMLRSADIVYVGLVSGLGMLRNVVFAGSRLTVGESYDELVDEKSGTHYYSGEELRIPGREKYHDFGYFASFPGPDGNHLVVIAGMRDTGLRRLGETLTSPSGVQALSARIAPGTPGLEALYEVYGLAGSSVGARLVLAGPLVISRLWHDSTLGP